MRKTSRITEGEVFLQKFHEENPGCTPAIFGLGRTSDGLSSYDHLSRLVSLSSKKKSLSVVDLACGDGFLLHQLAQKNSSRNWNLIGIDMSAAELDMARSRQYESPVTFYQAKAQSLPLADNSIDFIVCHMAFMLMNHLDQVVAEIHRCLKPGGVFSAILVGKYESNPAQEMFTALLDKALRLEGQSWIRNLGDHRTYSMDGLQSLFRSSKFSEIETQDFKIEFHEKPENLMSFFMLMYDVALLSKRAQIRLQKNLSKSLKAICDSNGTMRMSMWLQQATIRKK